MFSKFFVCAALVLLLLAVAIKIHSVLSFPCISEWNYHQLGKIGKTQNEFSFVVFGDNKNSLTTFENLIGKVNEEDTLFAIDVGDLVYDGEKEKYRFFINQIMKLDKPLLTVLGNHDIREQGRANYYELFGKYYYSFAVGNSYFIILDNANERNLDSFQFDWLKNELERSQSYKHRFVFMHVPLYDPRRAGKQMGHSLKDLAFAKELNELLDRNRVTMLFVSHIHGYYRGQWGKTPYIITGGAGAELAGSDPRHYFYHYIKVDISQQGVEYQVVKLKSPDFELIDRWIHDGWIYIYAFFAIHFFDSVIILALIYLGAYTIFIKKEWLIWNIGRKGR
ncbi:MAG: metallophosphoesterase [Actinobacteria bacterium]|nr:metallophosphoesterase [Actinomycetota bacterium]